jgi:YVTN family beta-propeller protein
MASAIRSSSSTLGLARLAAVVLALLPAVACARTAPAPPAPLRVYVSNETAGTVVVIDPATGQIENRIAVGKRPRGLRFSRDGSQLLVALSGSPIAGPGVDESTLPEGDRSADGIGVVDVATRKLIRTYPSGQDPESFDLSPDGQTMYVSNEETAEMSILDLRLGTIVGRVGVGEEPEGVTIRPDGKVVYVTCEGDNTVVAIDTASKAVLARMATGARPRSIAFTSDGAVAFVTGETDASITVIDAQAHKPISKIVVDPTPGTPMPPRPMGAVLSPDGRHVFVSNGRAKSIAVIDVSTRRVARVIEDVGTRPWGIGVSPDGRKIYTANGPSGDVSIVDVASGVVDRKVSVGDSPWGIAVTPSR